MYRVFEIWRTLSYLQSCEFGAYHTSCHLESDEGHSFQACVFAPQSFPPNAMLQRSQVGPQDGVEGITPVLVTHMEFCRVESRSSVGSAFRGRLHQGLGLRGNHAIICTIRTVRTAWSLTPLASGLGSHKPHVIKPVMTWNCPPLPPSPFPSREPRPR